MLQNSQSLLVPTTIDSNRKLKMSLQGGKKRVKWSDELEIVCNVCKFMKTESEAGITIPLSKVQKTVAEATRVSRRTLCRVLTEGENVEAGVTMAFSTPHKLLLPVRVNPIAVDKYIISYIIIRETTELTVSTGS